MSENMPTHNPEKAEVQDTVSKVAPSANSKLLFILFSAIFSAVVLYFMFFRTSKDKTKPKDLDKITIEPQKIQPTRDRSASELASKLPPTIPEDNDAFFQMDVSRVPQLPELPVLSKDVSKQLEQELREELARAERRQKEDYFTKEEVNAMIEKKLSELKAQQKRETPISPPIQTRFTSPVTTPPVTPSPVTSDMDFLAEDATTKEKRLEILKKASALKERKNSPIFKIKGGTFEGSSEKKDVDSIVILDKDLLMNIKDTEGEILPTKTPDLSRAILQGKIIDAVLESAINNDVKAPVRAIVIRDVYAEYGKNVLIPRGSRLIGEYTADVRRGQTRVTINWARIIRVDGLSLNISAMAVDNLGRGGLDGQVDNKYTEILGTAFLSTMLTIASAAAIENITGSTGISSASTTTTGNTIQTAGSPSDYALVKGTKDFMDKASQLVDELAQQRPTIRIAQGTKIIVMVNQDLALPLYKSKN
jgi:type IV secretion system protein VirB10